MVKGGCHYSDAFRPKIILPFLYNGTRSLFEKAGFSFERTKGTKNCVMRRTVSPSWARRYGAEMHAHRHFRMGPVVQRPPGW